MGPTTFTTIINRAHMETTGYMNRANHALTASSSSVTDVLASLDMPRNRLAAHQHIVAGVSPEVVIKLVALLGCVLKVMKI